MMRILQGPYMPLKGIRLEVGGPRGNQGRGYETKNILGAVLTKLLMKKKEV